MIAVAGGILLAIFVLLVLSGLWLCVRDTVRFMWRYKLQVAVVLGGLGIYAVVAIAGSYTKFPTYVQR